ncbi:MAG: hypothetical protein ABIR68_10615 [Ilumatobacteraceae bacterium]
MSDDWNPNDPDATRVHYDLSGWSFDQQAELASDLAEAEIPHAWDGAELLVPEEFEVAADTAVALVEERLGIDDEAADAVEVDSAPQPIELADDTVTTEYDLTEWSDDERHTVGTLLVRQHLPFMWNEHVLLVATEHEDSVEAILDGVESGETEVEPVIDVTDEADALPAEPGAERLPFETLTTFFLAGERLQKHPLDADGLQLLLKALDVAEPTNPPYGVERPLWTRTCELADELADALTEEDEPDEETAAEVAAELHDLLRPFV